MDIKNTKPLGGEGALPGPDHETSATSRDKASFADLKSKLQTSAPGVPQQPSVLAGIAKSGAAALRDPGKLVQMVNALASELINSGLNITGPLSKEEKKALSDFLSSDPLISSELENYLKKVVV